LTFSGRESNCQFDSQPFFGHNLCFKCLNGSCKPILDIYISIVFQWYKELFKPMGFVPCNCSLKIWESIGSPFGSVRVHSLTLFCTLGSMRCDPRLPSWPTTLQALALVASPKLGLRHYQNCKMTMIPIKLKNLIGKSCFDKFYHNNPLMERCPWCPNIVIEWMHELWTLSMWTWFWWTRRNFFKIFLPHK